MDNDVNSLLQEALIDLAITLKKNTELMNENIKLKQEMEEKKNDIKRLKNKESDSH